MNFKIQTFLFVTLIFMNMSSFAQSTGKLEYSKSNTALLIVDPYNDFMSKGGKLFEATKESREKFNTLDNMRSIIAKARENGIQVIIVPHHRATKNDILNWKYPTPVQIKGHQMQTFGAGTWGGKFNHEFGPKEGDVVVSEHYSQSGFANTNLNLELRQRGFDHIILIGMIANSCIESTGKYAVDLWYHVTLVKDATAAFSLDGMHTAHEVNGPTFAQSLVTTKELILLISSINK